MIWLNALSFTSMVYRIIGFRICRSKELRAMFLPNATFAALPKSFWEILTIVVASFLFNDLHYVGTQSFHKCAGARESGAGTRAKSTARDPAFIPCRRAAGCSDSSGVR